MPSYTMTDIRVVPLSGVRVVTAGSPDDVVYAFDDILEGSSYQTARIYRITSEAGRRIVGGRIEASAILPYSNVQTLQSDLIAIETGTILECQIFLKALDGQDGGAWVVIKHPDDDPLAEQWSIEVSEESAQWRPHTTLKIVGLFSPDALTKSPAFWREISGF